MFPMHLLLKTVLTAVLSFSSAVFAGDARPIVTIGLVDTFSPEFYIHSYSPTLDHLINNLKQYRFSIVEIDYRNISSEIDKKKPDFLVTSASDYAALFSKYGTQQIATKEPKASPSVSQTTSSTFVVPASSPYRKISDLKGKHVAITDRNSFDGWLIALGELEKRHFDSDNFFSRITETHYGIPSVISLLRRGSADVGILSTCEFEQLTETGVINRNDFRVLEDISGGNGCLRSTERYPDVVFSSMPQVSAAVVRNVTVALLTMPSENLSFQWTVANDFRQTFDLLKALHRGPFEVDRSWSFKSVWKKYRTEVLLAAALLLALIFHILSINILVARRTRELSDSLAETKRFSDLAQESRRRLMQLERMNIVSQLSSMFAHEIKQPITNIGYYAGALKLLLKRQKSLTPEAENLLTEVGTEVQKSADIVEHVRSYSKKHPRQLIICSLQEIIRKSAEAFPDENIRIDCPAENAEILADPFELEFIVSNFIKNSVAAVKDVARPSIGILLTRDADFWRLCVTDNGPAIPDEQFSYLGKVGQSTKAEGLGFGLAIATAIAEGCGGHLEFKRLEPNGLSVSLLIQAYRHNELND